MSHLTKSEKRFVNQLAHAHAQIYEIHARGNMKARLLELKADGVTGEQALAELQKLAPQMRSPVAEFSEQ
ncbi:hypothetical protein [Alcanivorax sp.]|uniref:hypothetical protein n=1 Tax=Alcanivorax sp. TaxID=1872427 RepID=UPI000C37CBFC|nr:hypothetical protein [Alcanivorax sp.]MBU85401.1 hypothetical protein [Alcanivorax sp.]